MPTTDCAVWPADTAPFALGRFDEVEIDPLALLLPTSVYVRLTLPDPAPLEVLRQQARIAVRRMSPRERAAAVARLGQLNAALEIARKELGG
jgi:hypothetical protein